MSKNQYGNIKRFCDKQNANILPNYCAVSIQKKDCYPNDIFVDEYEARVGLQSLVEHTCNQVLIAIAKELENLPPDETTECCCEFSYGFDGSSGFSQYQQQINIESSKSDKSLFVSSLCLLRIKSNEVDVWVNPSPASVRFNRPIWLIYAKESDSLVKKVDRELKKLIDNLQPFNIVLSNGAVVAFTKFNFNLTLIDGKVMSILCETSTQSCPNCNALPKVMKNVENVINKKFKIIESTKRYGFSLLHMQIQMFNSLYNTAAKKITKKARSGQTDAVKENKQVIRNRFREKMSLLVDIPNPKGGNTTNGNTARRAFGDVDNFAYCLGFDDDEKEIIVRVRNILLALQSGRQLNMDKLSEYCHESHLIWFELFPWSSPSPYTHRLFAHSFEISSAFPLPMSMYTEEASEAKNKFYKSDRFMHARKTSRIHNLTDILHRSLETSSYLLSIKNFNLRKPVNKCYPIEVENFFLEEESPSEDNEICTDFIQHDDGFEQNIGDDVEIEFEWEDDD